MVLPVLAIWGAGRSNDIDLARLAERFKLVLIDRDAEGLAQACKTYGLEETDAICVDLPFWNVELLFMVHVRQHLAWSRGMHR